MHVNGWDEVQGLGDAVWVITHDTGIYKLADVYTDVTGKDCGCDARHQWLNEKVPFS